MWRLLTKFDSRTSPIYPMSSFVMMSLNRSFTKQKQIPGVRIEVNTKTHSCSGEKKNIRYCKTNVKKVYWWHSRIKCCIDHFQCRCTDSLETPIWIRWERNLTRLILEPLIQTIYATCSSEFTFPINFFPQSFLRSHLMNENFILFYLKLYISLEISWL